MIIIWSDEVYLIKYSDHGTDENGFNTNSGEVKRMIFANEVSLTTSEFYASQKADDEKQIKLQVMKIDYEGEILCEYKGVRYKITRDYNVKSNDITELTLSKQKG